MGMGKQVGNLPQPQQRDGELDHPEHSRSERQTGHRHRLDRRDRKLVTRRCWWVGAAVVSVADSFSAAEAPADEAASSSRWAYIRPSSLIRR